MGREINQGVVLLENSVNLSAVQNEALFSQFLQHAVQDGVYMVDNYWETVVNLDDPFFDPSTKEPCNLKNLVQHTKNTANSNIHDGESLRQKISLQHGKEVCLQFNRDNKGKTTTPKHLFALYGKDGKKLDYPNATITGGVQFKFRHRLEDVQKARYRTNDTDPIQGVAQSLFISLEYLLGYYLGSSFKLSV
ncbi:hypothetical protein OROMI_017372 [Orobanche minor]